MALYQRRHSDTQANPHAVYVCFALLIFIVVSAGSSIKKVVITSSWPPTITGHRRLLAQSILLCICYCCAGPCHLYWFYPGVVRGILKIFATTDVGFFFFFSSP